MPLPTKKTSARLEFEKFQTLIYGPRFIGKSKFCSEIPDVCFLATEQGLGHLNVYKEDITDWKKFKELCREIAQGKHPFKHFTIDTIANLYRYCREYVLAELGVKHESDVKGFAKGFDLVNGEFNKVMVRFLMLPYGFTIVAHTRVDEIETPTGNYKKTSPDLPKSPRELLLQNVYLILYCDLENKKEADGSVTTRRVIRTKGTRNYEAGTKGIVLPDVIDLNYSKFVEEFNKGVKV